MLDDRRINWKRVVGITIAFLIVYTGGCPLKSDKPDYFEEGLDALLLIICAPIWIPIAAIGLFAWALGYLKVTLFGPGRPSEYQPFRPPVNP